jgi:hypothetical protein
MTSTSSSMSGKSPSQTSWDAVPGQVPGLELGAHLEPHLPDAENAPRIDPSLRNRAQGSSTRPEVIEPPSI